MMNQPEQSFTQNVTELFQQRTHSARKRRISKLFNFTAHGRRSRT